MDHLNRSLRFETDNLRARNLKVMVLRKLDKIGEANALLQSTLLLDPLDRWARLLNGVVLADGDHGDLQTQLDLAHDLARSSFTAEAIQSLLQRATGTVKDLPDQSLGALPLVRYTLGWLHERQGDQKWR